MNEQDTQNTSSHPRVEPMAGSPDQSEPAFLAVGRLRRPHGLKGDVLMEVITDFPERLKKGVQVYVGEGYIPLKIRSRRPHIQGMLIAFEAHPDAESVNPLRNQWVFVRTEDSPNLPEGEFYQHQILGMAVMDEDSKILGKVVEILETGANDVYIVRPNIGPDILLPAIPSVITDISLEDRVIFVHLIPGLLPE
jgi:16S rRNA processing protein RimM